MSRICNASYILLLLAAHLQEHRVHSFQFSRIIPNGHRIRPADGDSTTSLAAEDNIGMFGGDSAIDTSSDASSLPGGVSTASEESRVPQVGRLKDEAARLRKEAADMEVALREEARAKGLPEDVINKLIPIRAARTATSGSDAATASSSSGTAVLEKPAAAKYSWKDVRSKLGYLNTGDAVRISSELDRIKGRGFLRLWDTQDISKATFTTNDYQLKVKTGIEPAKLKLDDAGFNYQSTFIGALGFATVFGVGSSFVGGELGFVLGYLSALLPIGLVGVGSIAPGLIADSINRFRFATDEQARRQYVRMNAGKFLTGYLLGLPMASFSAGGISSRVDFFQLRPSDRSASEAQQMNQRSKKFKQVDIARSSVVCLAGAVAECMEYGEAGGTNANDVNVLYELISSVDDPKPLSPEAVQSHIRWSAVTAYEILKEHKEEFERVVSAFEKGLPLEECIAVIEGTEGGAEDGSTTASSGAQ